MKQYIIIILLITLSFSAISQNYFIKTDILGPVINRPFSFGFEKSNNYPNSFVFNIDGGWYMRDKALEFNQLTWKKSITGFSLTPEYRHYFHFRSNINKPVGLFAGGYARLIKLKYVQDFIDSSIEDVTEKTYGAGLGVVAGYKYKKPYSKFYFETLAGYSLGYINIDNYENDYLPDQYMFWRLEFCIGYAFQ